MLAMLRNFLLFVCSFFLASNVSVTAAFAANIHAGEKAPTISVTATNGKLFDLSQQKGKFVILEWTNHGCPFVRKHYDSGNMQKLQQYANNNDMVWVSVISSAKGKQGNVDVAEANQIAKDNNATPSYIILDEDGSIGRAYGAKTTPHMMLINPKGQLVYNGAVDSINSAEQEDVLLAEKYFFNAMLASKKGEVIDIHENKPYGCAIKY
ncbi:MAG: redoxin family protein [Rickettsiales bacterium]|jgi:peroxiredoxin|nr:redoxin family protein [Rickettsiales bacterium]